MNPILQRQLRRLGIDVENPPADPEVWASFLERVEHVYENSDQTRSRLEDSLEMASEEIQQLHAELEARARSVERTENHYRNLFVNSPIAMWEEDFTEVAAFLGALKGNGVGDLRYYLDHNPEDLDHAISLITVQDANHAASELFEAGGRESLIGNLDPEDITNTETFMEQFLAVWRGDSKLDMELEMVTLEGKPLDGILSWRVPTMGSQLDLTRVLVAIADITERKAAETRMAELARSKDEFLAAISHELRTPLTTVYGVAESLQEQYVDMSDEERRELLHLLAVESRDLAHLIEDLLVASRADIGKVVVRRMPVDLQAEVATVLEPIELEQGIVLDAAIEGWATADPLRFRQILRNLITNAIRYGGEIIRVESKTNLEGSFIYVWDNGSGIPEESREAIFEPYQRAHDRVGLPTSVGLGLTISRQLARLMGGDLTYDHISDWSVFTLRLPLHIDIGEVA
ncbi:MAG: HAMP domain-containing sensor histidine kinase [Acidimicrobiia bacterium]